MQLRKLIVLVCKKTVFCHKCFSYEAWQHHKCLSVLTWSSMTYLLCDAKPIIRDEATEVDVTPCTVAKLHIYELPKPRRPVCKRDVKMNVHEKLYGIRKMYLKGNPRLYKLQAEPIQMRTGRTIQWSWRIESIPQLYQIKRRIKIKFWWGVTPVCSDGTRWRVAIKMENQTKVRKISIAAPVVDDDDARLTFP